MILDVLYLILLVSTLAAMIASTVYAWRKRPKKGARVFAFYQFAATGILITILGSALASNTTEVFLWMRLRAPFQLISVTIYLLFALDYVGNTRWLKPSRVILLMAVPVILSILVIAPGTSHVMIGAVTTERNAFLIYEVSFDKVIGYWIGVVYAYIALILAMLLFFRHAVISKAPYRWQASILFFVSLITIVVHFLNLMPFLPSIMPNLIVVGLLVRAVIITWALFSFRLFDIMPIALRSVFERLPIGLLVLDVQGNIIEINPIAVTESKRTHESMVGASLREVFPRLGAFADRIAPDQEQSEELDFELNPGDKRYFEAHLVPLFSRNGQIAGRLLTVRDITRRKIAEIEREALIDTLDSYAHTVAHDLKNPIGLVLGYAYLMQEEFGNSFPESQMYLKSIIEASNRNVRIIDDLLLFASVRKRGEIAIHQFEMRPTLNEALIRIEQSISKSTSSPSIRVVTEIPDAIGYPLWVEEIWVNYVSNAIKYGGKPPHVEIGASREGRMIRYWVRDNGEGLSEEDQSRLFRSVGRLEQHRPIAGHGLGLTICARIAVRLGGAVGVESEIGKGSTFWFTLPAAPEAT